MRMRTIWDARPARRARDLSLRSLRRAAAIEARGHSFEAFRQVHQFETGSRRARPPCERSQLRRRIAQFLGAALYVFIDHTCLPPAHADNAPRMNGFPATGACHVVLSVTIG